MDYGKLEDEEVTEESKDQDARRTRRSKGRKRRIRLGR